MEIDGGTKFVQEGLGPVPCLRLEGPDSTNEGITPEGGPVANRI